MKLISGAKKRYFLRYGLKVQVKVGYWDSLVIKEKVKELLNKTCDVIPQTLIIYCQVFDKMDLKSRQISQKQF